MKKLMLLVFCFSTFFFYACDQKQISNLRIMSYNIRHGQGMDNVLDLSRAADIIKLQAPDLCALQEIDNYCLRSDSLGQTEYLADEAGMTGTFGKFMSYEGGEYGMATLSSKPLISVKNLKLPDGKYEPRSSLIHEVQIAKGCAILFVNVHFDWINDSEGELSRLNQAKALLKYIDAKEHAVIITGDFNCTPDSPTMNYFKENGFEFINKGVDSMSFQGTEKAEIDHIIFRRTNRINIEAKRIMLLDEPLVSDHRPLIAELEITF
ncbi:MAG: hypothetical protein C0598_09160 [Marinilabiliales bacterium]|nr:MAG: hypothetical protein C0598_09160 [Marinilabiliales bacterium]